MPTEVNAAEEIKARALALGFDLVGVCPAVPSLTLAAYRQWIDKGYHASMDYLREHLPLKETPQSLLPGARSIIAVGLNYNQPNEPKPGHPRIAKYALGRDYHKVLRSKLHRLAQDLQALHPEARTRACVDSAPILERDYARLAGLGWFGKNTCLIDSKRGSYFFIGLLITTAELEPDAPAVGGCGSCTRCIDACPTGAIVFEDDRWQVNASRCISYLTIEHEGPIELELTEKMGDWFFGCDVCQDVCPFNQSRDSQPLRAPETLESDFLQKRKWPSLQELAELNAERFDELTRGSPLRRAGLDGLRRNAGIVLANTRASRGA